MDFEDSTSLLTDDVVSGSIPDAADTAPETTMMKISRIVSLNTLYCVLLSFFAGNTFGVNFSQWASATKMYQHWGYDITEVKNEIATSAIVLGALSGVIVSGMLADTVGRKTTNMLSGVIATCGTIVSVFTHSYYPIVIIRFGIGIGVGMASSAAPMHVSELVDPAIRGVVASLFQVFICFGILYSYIVGMITVPYTAWWASTLSTIVFPIGIIAVSTFIPESPKFVPGRKAKTDPDPASAPVGWWATFTQYPKPLFYGFVLASGQQLTGVNGFIMYAPSVFSMAGFASAALLGSVGVGAVNFLSTLVGLPLSDRLGRKPLLLFGFGLMIIADLIAAACFSVIELSGFRALSFLGVLTTPAGWIIIFAIFLFLLGFEIGPGPLFFVLASEIAPIEVKGRMMAVIIGLQWLWTLVITLLFLSVTQLIGKGPTFFIFAVIGVVAWCAVLTIPETRGRPLQDIHQTMRGRRARERFEGTVEAIADTDGEGLALLGV